MSARDDRGLEGLVSQVEARERSARRRALVYTLVPIVVASLLLIYTSNRLREYNQELEQMRAELDASQQELSRVERELAAAERKLAATEKQLSDTTDLARFSHPIEYQDIKIIGTRLPSDALVLLDQLLTLRDQEVPWQLGGRGLTGTEGFDSPGLAYYVLGRVRLVEEIGPGERVRPYLCGKLKRAERPRPGDLACYRTGYTMFYYRDVAGQPFVIGMTPMGVVALKPGFAGAPDYRRTGIS